MRQLRPLRPAEEDARLYAATYDHTRWADHRARVTYTAVILAAMAPASVADLSCGDGAIVGAAGLACPAWLGDLTPGWPYHGPVEQTIMQIPAVDVFVCSETLEHVHDPGGLLALIRGKAARLLLSTPAGEDDDRNPEHYWGWDTGDLDAMLAAAGWADRTVELFTPPPAYYTFQIWRCH